MPIQHRQKPARLETGVSGEFYREKSWSKMSVYYSFVDKKILNTRV